MFQAYYDYPGHSSGGDYRLDNAASFAHNVSSSYMFPLLQGGGGAYRNFQIFANRNNLIKFLTLGNVINVLLYKFL